MNGSLIIILFFWVIPKYVYSYAAFLEFGVIDLSFFYLFLWFLSLENRSKDILAYISFLCFT